MKLKGKAFEKALKTKDVHRLDGIPLIQDETKLITPEIAEKMLNKNEHNRPINWNKVEQYRKLMENNEWKFHAQGIILDEKDNILTGQKRLWAIIYSKKAQYMRISKGTPASVVHLIDRGTAQSSRDLASRKTERKHSPTEASIVRAMYALSGKLKPNADDISAGIVKYDEQLKEVMKKTRGVKKTKAVLMMTAAICELQQPSLFGSLEPLAEILEEELAPIEIKACWNRGAAFTFAMERAVKICKDNV